MVRKTDVLRNLVVSAGGFCIWGELQFATDIGEASFLFLIARNVFLERFYALITPCHLNEKPWKRPHFLLHTTTTF